MKEQKACKTYRYDAKAQATTKLKTFLYQSIKRVKRQCTKWENICKSCLIRAQHSDYIQKLQFNNKRAHNPVLKWAKNLNKYFSKDGIQITKEFSTSLGIREMQIKSTGYHFTPTKMSVFKTMKNNLLARSWKNWISCSLLVGRNMVQPL